VDRVWQDCKRTNTNHGGTEARRKANRVNEKLSNWEIALRYERASGFGFKFTQLPSYSITNSASPPWRE
jgi:hypothetical protein